MYGFPGHICVSVGDVAVHGVPGTLTDGLVIAVEPIIADGDTRCVQERDGWTIRTATGTLAAHSEHTIVVRDGAPLVLTA